MSTGASTPSPSPPASPPGLTLDAFAKLLRSKPDSLDAYFGEICAATTLPATRATVHCRYLKIGGNGRPRVNDLANCLANQLLNYAIPRKQIAAAEANAHGLFDSARIVALYRKANRLFTDLEKTGEGGELLLYLMTETYLRIPQLLCKMPLKTSSHMHYHGADGIHGLYDPSTKTLAMYWGESKLYATLSSAIDACFASLAPLLIEEGGSEAPQTRDLQLLVDNVDLGDPQLESALLRYLDPDDPLFNRLTYRGVALVGFDSNSYKPGKAPLTEVDLCHALETGTSSWHNCASNGIAKHKLDSVEIELFCVPLPSVGKFREAFLKELGIK